MALLHLSVHTISRSKGTSACAAAAYRAGEKIHSEYDGSTYDYTKKQNVVFSEIMLPENAPVELAHREYLWNHIETKIETQSNSRLAREFDIALPLELTFDQQREVTEAFLRECFIKDGGIADVCFHNPPLMNSKNQPLDVNGIPTKNPEEYVYRNPHVHVMLPYRPIVDGDFAPKIQKLYVCEKAGVQKSFSAPEYKQVEGWEKLYNYESMSGKKSWHTKSYALEHPEECYKQVNRYPKCEQRQNPIVAKWDDPETLVEWRSAWAGILNKKFEELGIDIVLDHRSYEAQGLDLIPTIHEGKKITYLEKKYSEDSRELHTEIRNLNLAIREHNQEIQILEEFRKLNILIKEFLDAVLGRIDLLGQSIADTLEKIRVELILTRKNLTHAAKLREEVDDKLLRDEAYIKEIKLDKKKLNILNNRKEKLKQQYDSLNPTLYKRKRELIAEQIEYVENQIDIFNENIQNANLAQSEIQKLQILSNKLDNRIEKYSLLFMERVDEYRGIANCVSNDSKPKIDTERLRVRVEYEKRLKQIIGEIDLFDTKEYVDKMLISSTQVINKYDTGIKLKQ